MSHVSSWQTCKNAWEFPLVGFISHLQYGEILSRQRGIPTEKKIKIVSYYKILLYIK